MWFIDWIFGQWIPALNVLAFTLPIVFFAAIQFDHRLARPLRDLAAIGGLIAPYIVMWFAYPFIGFPLWMRWFHFS